MAEAKATLTLTPREFDLVREAVKVHHSECIVMARDKSAGLAAKDAARRRAVELDALIGKLF
jgi:hypothetical protein